MRRVEMTTGICAMETSARLPAVCMRTNRALPRGSPLRLAVRRSQVDTWERGERGEEGTGAGAALTPKKAC